MNKLVLSENVEKYIELTKGFKTLCDKNDDKCDEYLDRLDKLWEKMSNTERCYVQLKVKKL
jgi:hypothetical protein